MQIELNLIALHYFASTFFVLLFYHFLADFPLQGDYMAKAKIPLVNPPGIWFFAMFGHSVIHAGFVFLATKQLSLALLQLVTHFAIDFGKCDGWFGEGSKAFVRDQVLHIAVLVLIALLYCEQ